MTIQNTVKIIKAAGQMDVQSKPTILGETS